MHPYEKLLIWLIAIPVCGLPWAFGGTPLWAQLAALPFCIAAFVVALLPRLYGRDLTQGEAYIIRPWDRLKKFPILWLGLVFFAYVGIQMLNPAWEMKFTPNGGWYMQRIDYIKWLPHGVTGVPVRLWPPWVECLRQVMAWVLVCTCYAALNTSTSKIYLALCMAFNGTILAIIGIAQQASNTLHILWSFNSNNPDFFSTFINRNHGAAFLIITMAINIHIAAKLERRHAITASKSNPSILFYTAGVLCWIAVIATGSRAGAIIGVLLGIYYLVLSIIRRNSNYHSNAKIYISIAGLIIIFSSGYLAFYNIGLSQSYDRIKASTFNNSQDSLTARLTATKATLQLGAESVATGNGLGSFKFLFPKVQIKHQILGVKNDTPTQWWQHAHNDFAETFSDMGIIGGFIAALIAGIALFLTKDKHLMALFICIAFHSLVEFNLQIPALIINLSCAWGVGLSKINPNESQ